MSNDGDIRTRILLDTEEFTRGVEEVQRRAQGLKGSLEASGRGIAGSMSRMREAAGSLRASALGTIATVGKAAYETAARVYDVAMSFAKVADDAADTGAYMARTFGSRAGEAGRWAEETARQYGLYESAVEGYYTRLYEAVAGSGVGRDEAMRTAQDLVKLRYDLSAVLKWYSEDQIEGWIMDVASSGKEEAFRRLLPGRDFESAAKALGLYSENMTDAQRRTAMMTILTSEYGDEVGAWARNLETATGASARLDASVMRLKESIGSALSPVLAGFVNLLADMVDAVNEFGAAVGRLTSSGDEAPDRAALVREVSAAMRQLTQDTEEAAKASAGLAGFDRLNRIDVKAEEEGGKGKDWSGLNAWMLMWQEDADLASTAADDLWTSILDSGETTAEGLRGRFGELFEWMRSEATVDVDVQDSAIDTAYSRLSETVAQYRSAVESLGITLDDVPGLAGASDRLKVASERVSALTEELSRARAAGDGVGAESAERELAEAVRDRGEAERQAALAESVDSLARAYGAGIQGIYGRLALDMGAYTGQIVSALSTGSIREVQDASEKLRKAVDGIDIPAYSDSGLRTDLSGWLSENEAGVSAALRDLPVNASAAEILSKFAESGVMVDDPQAGAAAEAIAGMAGASTLLDLVDASGGVASAVASAQAEQTGNMGGMSHDLSKWIDDNEEAVSGAIGRLPVDSDYEDILDAFERQGIDVSDPSAQTAATALSSMPGDIWTQVGGVVGLKKALGPQAPDLSPSLDGIAGAIEGIRIPDQGDRLDELAGMIRSVQEELDGLRGTGQARAVEEAESEAADWGARQKEAEARYSESVSSPGGALPVQSLISGARFVGESIYNAVNGARAEDELRRARDEARPVPDRDPLEGKSQRIQLRGYAERGTPWSGLPARLRPAVSADEWADALLFYSASGGPAKGDRYSQRRDEVARSHPALAGLVDEYESRGTPWDSLPQQILEELEGMGIRGYASGGVFAPNSPVLGVLGDNRREVEVAAPYSTIVRAVRDAMGAGGPGSSRRIELTANLNVDGRTVAREIYPYIVEEGKRVGRTIA